MRPDKGGNTMRRTICALMLLGAVGGCGSDDEEAGTTADRQPPTVAITAASSVEGGETVPLSVTVTDNVDSGLTPTIACSGGTLTGTMLVVPLVTAATTITCTATAVDKAGNTGTGTVTIAVRPSTASLTVAGGTTTITQSKLVVLLADNLSLTEASYTGTVGGKSVSLVRGDDGKSLIFATPEGLSAGAQTLTVKIGARSFDFPLTAIAAPSVSNPRGVVLAYLTKNRDDARAFLTSNAAGLNATARDDITAQVNRIQTAIDAIGGAPDSDLQAMAIYLQANGLIEGGALSAIVSRTASNLASSATRALAGNQVANQKLCDAYANTFLIGVFAAVGAAKVTSLALPFIGTPVGFGVAAAGGLLTYLAVDLGVGRSIEGILSTCFDLGELQLNSYSSTNQAPGTQPAHYVTALAATGRLTFSNDKAATFRLTGRRTLFQSIAGSVQGAAQRFNALAVSKNFVPQPLATLVQRVVGYDETVPAGTVALGNVSNNISGTLSAVSNDTISLRFKANDPTSEMIDFGFTLTPAEGKPVNVDATLSLSLPKVNDASVTTTQGQAVASTLQVSGADTLEVVTQPTLGTVSLQSNGAFTYTPTGQAFGSDKFTYRGRNANGVSAAATVLVTVSRKFDGTWRVTSRTTTTSQSSPNLCPNETNTFTISVNKVSDTQYTASYQGFPITLSMSSATDPAGLSGTATATYPDDPGTSTDTINVQIPNSTTLTGNGTFSYTGPNSSRCSGTIAISGTR